MSINYPLGSDKPTKVTVKNPHGKYRPESNVPVEIIVRRGGGLLLPYVALCEVPDWNYKYLTKVIRAYGRTPERAEERLVEKLNKWRAKAAARAVRWDAFQAQARRKVNTGQ